MFIWKPLYSIYYDHIRSMMFQASLPLCLCAGTQYFWVWNKPNPAHSYCWSHAVTTSLHEPQWWQQPGISQGRLPDGDNNGLYLHNAFWDDQLLSPQYTMQERSISKAENILSSQKCLNTGETRALQPFIIFSKLFYMMALHFCILMIGLQNRCS